jgi:hypothetical protein
MIIKVCLGLSAATAVAVLVLLQTGAARSTIDILVGLAFGLAVPAILEALNPKQWSRP